MAANNQTAEAFRACYRKDAAALARLLGAGVSVNARNDTNEPLLVHAVREQATDCMEVLISHSSSGGEVLDVQALGAWDKTALWWATQRTELEIVRMLLRALADPSAVNLNPPTHAPPSSRPASPIQTTTPAPASFSRPAPSLTPPSPFPRRARTPPPRVSPARRSSARPRQCT